MSKQMDSALPRHLDEPTKIFFFPVEECFVFMGIFLIVFFSLDSPLLGVFAGSLPVALYRKCKDGHGRAYALGLLYWYLPSVLGLKATAQSHLRLLKG